LRKGGVEVLTELDVLELTQFLLSRNYMRNGDRALGLYLLLEPHTEVHVILVGELILRSEMNHMKLKAL
jgi:hypothetical protein